MNLNKFEELKRVFSTKKEFKKKFFVKEKSSIVE